ncbi:MAG: hypothetical protein AAFO58_13130, partial [Pseudomonadota bacterium]
PNPKPQTPNPKTRETRCRLNLVSTLRAYKMINFILMVNKLGQTRLAQYYKEISNGERKTLESELVRKCLGRDDSKCSIIVHRNFKIIYRRYVSLYFIVGIDLDEEVRASAANPRTSTSTTPSSTSWSRR